MYAKEPEQLQLLREYIEHFTFCRNHLSDVRIKMPGQFAKKPLLPIRRLYCTRFAQNAPPMRMTFASPRGPFIPADRGLETCSLPMSIADCYGSRPFAAPFRVL